MILVLLMFDIALAGDAGSELKLKVPDGVVTLRETTEGWWTDKKRESQCVSALKRLAKNKARELEWSATLGAELCKEQKGARVELGVNPDGNSDCVCLCADGSAATCGSWIVAYRASRRK